MRSDVRAVGKTTRTRLQVFLRALLQNARLFRAADHVAKPEGFEQGKNRAGPTPFRHAVRVCVKVEVPRQDNALSKWGVEDWEKIRRRP
jgi:hypothetical protein